MFESKGGSWAPIYEGGFVDGIMSGSAKYHFKDYCYLCSFKDGKLNESQPVKKYDESGSLIYEGTVSLVGGDYKYLKGRRLYPDDDTGTLDGVKYAGEFSGYELKSGFQYSRDSLSGLSRMVVYDKGMPKEWFTSSKPFKLDCDGYPIEGQRVELCDVKFSVKAHCVIVSGHDLENSLYSTVGYEEIESGPQSRNDKERI